MTPFSFTRLSEDSVHPILVSVDHQSDVFTCVFHSLDHLQWFVSSKIEDLALRIELALAAGQAEFLGKPGYILLGKLRKDIRVQVGAWKLGWR